VGGVETRVEGDGRRPESGGGAPATLVAIMERDCERAVAGARRDGPRHARLQRLPRPHQVRPQRRHEPGRLLRLPRPPRLRCPRPRRLPPREVPCPCPYPCPSVNFLSLLDMDLAASNQASKGENHIFSCHLDLVLIRCCRRVRPPVTPQLLASFALLGFTGLYGNPLLFLVGLRYTNASYAAAFQPSIPVLTFLLAAIVGVEAINIFTKDGVLKVIGTVVCVSGAILMAMYRGPSLIGLTRSMPNAWASTSYPAAPNWLASAMLEYGVETWQLGVLCLVGNCLLVAVYLVIQAPVMIKYPASLSVTAYSYFFATIFMVLTGVSATNGLHEWALTKTEIIAVLYAGIVASCLSYSIMTWANKILGPSLVALYNPLQPAFSTVLSTIFLGDLVYIGSIIGGVSIIVGLYLVIWARYNEEQRAPMDGYLDPLIVDNPRIPKTEEISFI